MRMLRQRDGLSAALAASGVQLAAFGVLLRACGVESLAVGSFSASLRLAESESPAGPLLTLAAGRPSGLPLAQCLFFSPGMRLGRLLLGALAAGAGSGDALRFLSPRPLSLLLLPSSLLLLPSLLLLRLLLLLQ